MNFKLLTVILILVIIAVNGLFIPHNLTNRNTGSAALPNSTAVEAATAAQEQKIDNEPEIDDRPGLAQYLPAGGRVKLTGKTIALTFDDGPHAGYTEQLLEVLSCTGVKATFFVVGEKVRERPDLVRSILAAGHTIANHSYDNSRLTRLSADEMLNKMQSTSDEIQLATGIRPKFFRPPGGDYNSTVGRMSRKEEMLPVFWTLNSTDSGVITSQQLATLLKSRVKQGDVVLMHDGQQATIDALPDVIAYFKAEGFRFVSLEELIDYE